MMGKTFKKTFIINGKKPTITHQEKLTESYSRIFKGKNIPINAKVISNTSQSSKIGINNRNDMLKFLVKNGLSTKHAISTISKGLKIESEHTPIHSLQERIAFDHLSEFPRYYDELSKLERKLSKG